MTSQDITAETDHDLRQDRLCRHVALKITVSETWQDGREVQILGRLSHGSAGHPGKRNIMQMLDHFEHTGPNGTHQCLVLELLGPSIVAKAESYASNRLPGSLAWVASKQTVQALAYIHSRGVAHGGQSWLISGREIFACSSNTDQDVFRRSPSG